MAAPIFTATCVSLLFLAIVSSDAALAIVQRRRGPAKSKDHADAGARRSRRPATPNRGMGKAGAGLPHSKEDRGYSGMALGRQTLGDDEGDVVVLFAGTELADFIHDGGKQSR